MGSSFCCKKITGGLTYMNAKAKELLKIYGIIVISSVIYAIAFNWFFDPNGISMGGITGVAQIINHFVPVLPVGLLIVVMNIPLFVLGVKYQGFHLLWSSLFAMVVSSIFIDVFPLFIDFPPMEDHLISCIFGGAILGASMGMMLWVGATTGGTELAASLLKRKFTHIQIGRICLLIDVIVVIIYAWAFHDINNALYAGVALFISATTMDAVIYGRKNSKVACIICSDGKAIMDALLEKNLGVTQIAGKGGFTQEDKTVLICAFKPSRIAMIKSVVIEKDPLAFVIICDAKDVFGEGFAECDLNSL